MLLNYYLKNDLYQVEVNLPCPGCGKMGELAVHEKVISHMRNLIDYFIGCNCGWHGPTNESPNEAAKAWDQRAD